MLVKGAREVAFEKLVVVDGLSNDATNKLEIAQVIWIAVWRGVDHIGDPIARWSCEESVHGVENLARNDDVPRIKNLIKRTKNVYENLTIHARGHLHLDLLHPQIRYRIGFSIPPVTGDEVLGMNPRRRAHVLRGPQDPHGGFRRRLFQVRYGNIFAWHQSLILEYDLLIQQMVHLPGE